MKALNFPAQSYEYNAADEKYIYEKKDDSIIGSLELLWTAINTAPMQLERKDHKVNKRLKRKIREVTCYKDKDKDARVCPGTAQVLILEEDELELLKRLLESGKFTSLASDDLDTLWEIIDGAKDYKLPKPVLVDADTCSSEPS